MVMAVRVCIGPDSVQLRIAPLARRRKHPGDQPSGDPFESRPFGADAVSFFMIYDMRLVTRYIILETLLTYALKNN